MRKAYRLSYDNELQYIFKLIYKNYNQLALILILSPVINIDLYFNCFK